MSVAQNVAFGLDIRAVSAEEKSQRVREAPRRSADGPITRAPAQPTLRRPATASRAGPGRWSSALTCSSTAPEQPRRETPARAALRDPPDLEIRHHRRVRHARSEGSSAWPTVAVVNQGASCRSPRPRRYYRRRRFVAEFLGETNLMPGASSAAPARTAGNSWVETPVGRLNAAVSRDVDVRRRSTRGAPV